MVLFLCTVLAVLYPKIIEPNWIAVHTIDLTLPHLSQKFEGYRLLQLTDIHADDWMTSKRLSRIVKLANQQHPDLVALTGDYVTNDPQKYAPTLAALKSLKASDGAIAVQGNHDAWTDSSIIHQALEQANILELVNDVISIQRDGERLNFAGVDDVWAQRARLDQVLAKLPQDGSAILLAHEPDYADTSSATGQFDLQLSGHSHGGQVKLPFTHGPILPPLGRRYPFGRYEVNGMIQYTSRGVGMVSPRIRFNARPEITVFQLHAPKLS